MKLKMKILERVLLPGMLPEKAKFEIGIVINDIKNKVAISQEEVTRTKLMTLANGGMQWDAAKDKGVEIEFTDAETEVIAGALKKTSDDGNLPTEPAVIKLYRDFVINPKVIDIKKKQK